MGKRYGTWKRKFKDASGQEKELYFACSRRGEVIGFDKLTDIITENTSLTPGDISNCLISLSRTIISLLEEGFSVRLDNIGCFSIAVTSDGFESPNDISPDKVRATKIVFTPDRKLNSKIKDLKFNNFDKRIREAIGKSNPFL
ncbi:MAG: HU family DNA-binding protein [Bacteroidales bacterium]|jgi:predicted histone-like DNA-binding protein